MKINAEQASKRITQELTRRVGLVMNLATPSSVQKLQTALHDKAKEWPKRRFHACTTRCTAGTYWRLLMNAAKPMAERQE
jgi:hypothetical protein